MNRFLKTFLIWMLAVMLPAQVTASSIKMTCGPGSHMPPQHAPELLHFQHDSDVAYAHHHAHHYHDMVGTNEEVSSSKSADMTGKFKSSYCSACAACCIGAAVAPTVLEWTPSSSSAIAPVLASVSSFEGFIPPGPERPPRPIAI